MSDERPSLNRSQIGKAAVKLRALSAEERARDLFERREKGWRDLASIVDGAEEKGRIEGQAEGRIDVARKLLSMNLPIEQITAATGLTRKEIELL